jgi:hypothetical protein
MKARLALILIGLAGFAVAAGTAQGTTGFAHTCNSSGRYSGVSALGIGFFGNTGGHAQLVENFDYQCGRGGTVEWKLQALIGGVWTTESDSTGAPIDHQARNTGRKGRWVFFSHSSSSMQPCGPGHSDYRLVVHDSTPGHRSHVIEHDFAASCP